MAQVAAHHKREKYKPLSDNEMKVVNKAINLPPPQNVDRLISMAKPVRARTKYPVSHLTPWNSASKKRHFVERMKDSKQSNSTTKA